MLSCAVIMGYLLITYYVLLIINNTLIIVSLNIKCSKNVTKYVFFFSFNKEINTLFSKDSLNDQKGQ